MTTSVITPASKNEIKSAITSKLDVAYNLFKGEIRRADKYAAIRYYFNGNKISIEVTYWKDGKMTPVDYMSHCTTPACVANKVAKFLGLK